MHKISIIPAVVFQLSCIRMLAPPPVPFKEVPFISMKPAPQHPHMGRVVFDVTPEKASIEMVTAEEHWSGTYIVGSSKRTGFICNSPCVADLPYGSYKIRYTSLTDPEKTSTDYITVGYDDTIVRHNLGLNSRNNFMLASTILIGVPGGILTLMGSAFAVADAASSNGMNGTMKMMLIVGVPSLLLSFVTGYFSETRQEGSTIQWAPADGKIYQSAP